MGNLILMAVLVVFGAGMFKIGYVGGTVREVFYGFRPTMLKTAVSVFNTEARLNYLGDYVKPYFDKQIATYVITTYFRAGLKGIQPSSSSSDIQYRVTINCGEYQKYPTKNDGIISVYPQELTIQLMHPITSTWTFDETRTFRISEATQDGV